MIDINKLNECLTLLNERLKIDEAARRIAVCGGSALIFTGVVARTTKDVDIDRPWPNPVQAEKELWRQSLYQIICKGGGASGFGFGVGRQLVE